MFLVQVLWYFSRYSFICQWKCLVPLNLHILSMNHFVCTLFTEQIYYFYFLQYDRYIPTLLIFLSLFSQQRCTFLRLRFFIEMLIFFILKIIKRIKLIWSRIYFGMNEINILINKILKRNENKLIWKTENWLRELRIWEL